MADRSGLHTAPVPGNPPLGTAPVDGRLVQGALHGTGGLCVAGGGLAASSTTMAFTVAAGVYQIPDTANGGAVYHSPIDAATLTPSAGQSGGRIDSIYVLQQDFEKNGSTSRVVYGLAAGTPGSGTAPSLSGIAGGPMRLANITVPASATKATDCTIAWVVPPAALLLPGPVAASKVLLDLIPGAYIGQLGLLTTGVAYRWNGSAWKLERNFTTDGFSPAGSVVNADSNAPSTVSRSGKNVVLFLNLNVGANGLSSGGVVITVPDGFRPYAYSPGRLEIVNGGAYQGTTVPVEVSSTGVVTLKAGSVTANYVIVGTVVFIAGD